MNLSEENLRRLRTAGSRVEITESGPRIVNPGGISDNPLSPDIAEKFAEIEEFVRTRIIPIGNDRQGVA